MNKGGINIINQKKILSIATIGIILISVALTIAPLVSAGGWHAVKGTLYINNNPAPAGIDVKIIFADENFSSPTFEWDGEFNYNIGLFGHEGETGTFQVFYLGKYWIIDPPIVYIEDKIGIYVDLYTSNNQPDKPINPSPDNNSPNIDLNPTLSVEVTDPDDDTMNVSFYNASDDSLIGTDTSVANGSTASVTWSDLSYNTTYHWYAIANDSQLETKSDTWSFTTKEEENENPKVCIVKPQRAIYIFNKKILPRFFGKALIIGDITIEVNATDEDSGIEKVEFYINGKLKGNDTTEPYMYNWTRDRLRLVHIFCIKVVAYDNDGATAKDCIIVRKLL